MWNHCTRPPRNAASNAVYCLPAMAVARNPFFRMHASITFMKDWPTHPHDDVIYARCLEGSKDGSHCLKILLTIANNAREIWMSFQVLLTYWQVWNHLNNNGWRGEAFSLRRPDKVQSFSCLLPSVRPGGSHSPAVRLTLSGVGSETIRKQKWLS